jgi:hypothetical protein
VSIVKTQNAAEAEQSQFYVLGPRFYLEVCLSCSCFSFLNTFRPVDGKATVAEVLFRCHR